MKLRQTDAGGESAIPAATTRTAQPQITSPRPDGDRWVNQPHAARPPLENAKSQPQRNTTAPPVPIQSHSIELV